MQYFRICGLQNHDVHACNLEVSKTADRLSQLELAMYRRMKDSWDD
jgi:hypothetical protein